MHIDFLKTVLMSECEYWVVAKRNEGMSTVSRGERYKDSIMFITIPLEIQKGFSYEEVTLKAMEQLYRIPIVGNVHLNEDYSPFQYGVTLRDVYFGYPVEINQKEFLIEALALKSDSIYDYKSLLLKRELCNTTSITSNG